MNYENKESIPNRIQRVRQSSFNELETKDKVIKGTLATTKIVLKFTVVAIVAFVGFCIKMALSLMSGVFSSVDDSTKSQKRVWSKNEKEYYWQNHKKTGRYK